MSARLKAIGDYAALLDKYDTWMFDCDGVLWSGGSVIDGAAEVLQMLRKHGKTLIFVTNNATKSRAMIKENFDRLGLQANEGELFGSAYASAVYISKILRLPKDKKVYVIGQSGLEQELRDEGIPFIGGTDPADNTLAPFNLADFTPDPDVAAVLCGLDMSINYTKLSKAFQYLKHPECHFLATNDDSTYPVFGGVLPGAGAISAPLKVALGKNPVSIGKPALTLLDCIRAKIQFNPARTLMIGDRLNTDILFGKNGGLSTLLVLTGITSEIEITGSNASSIVPDYFTQSIGDFGVLA